MSRSVQDEQLGRLEYDDRIGGYAGRLNTEHVLLRIDAESPADVAAAIHHARQVAASLANYEALAKQYAAEDLLTLKNDTWLEEDEAPLDSESFKKRMTLTSVVVSSDGQLCFYHHDGDLFWGHSIQVGIGPQRQKLFSDIPG